MKFDLKYFPKQNVASPDAKTTLSPEAGMTLRWFNFPPYNDEPKIWHLSAILADKQFEKTENDSGEVAGGSSIDFQKAITKLSGEVVERYTTSSNIENEVFCSWRELSEKGLSAIDPKELVISDENQKQKEKRRYEQVLWSQGIDLKSQQETFIPVQLISVPHIYADHEAVWKPPISTGAAAHSTLEGAIYAGICEIVERDAFQIAWLRQLRISKLQLSQEIIKADKSLELLLNLSKRYHLQCEVYQLPCSLPLNVCMSVVWDNTTIGPPCAVGAKCSPSLITAIRGAVEEAHQIRSWLRRLLDTYGEYKKLGPLKTLQDRARHWLTYEAAETLRSWIDESESIEVEDLDSLDFQLNLHELIEAIIKDDGTPYVVNLTKKIPSQALKLGWESAKVVIPQFQPLNLTEEMEDFALNRLNNVEERTGCEAIMPKNEIFKYPHPFL